MMTRMDQRMLQSPPKINEVKISTVEYYHNKFQYYLMLHNELAFGSWFHLSVPSPGVILLEFYGSSFTFYAYIVTPVSIQEKKNNRNYNFTVSLKRIFLELIYWQY